MCRKKKNEYPKRAASTKRLRTTGLNDDELSKAHKDAPQETFKEYA
jgi:hypothetical protein